MFYFRPLSYCIVLFFSHSPPPQKSLSKWVTFLEMFICSFRERASSSGACPRWLLLSFSPLRSSHWLFPCCFPLFSSTPPASSSPHFLLLSLSLTVSLLFHVTHSYAGCQVVCDNLRLMGIKRMWRTPEKHHYPPNIFPPSMELRTVKEQEVTRDKKQRSCADYWKWGTSSSRVLMGYHTPDLMATLWSSKPFSLSTSNSLAPCFLTWERMHVSWLQAWWSCCSLTSSKYPVNCILLITKPASL